MNNEDLYLAIGKTDHELLEKSEQVRNRRLTAYIRVLAAAAAVFLIISAVSALNLIRVSGDKMNGGAFVPTGNKAAEAKNDAVYDENTVDKEAGGVTAAAGNDAEIQTEAPVLSPSDAEREEDLLQGVIPASTKSIMTSGRIALISLASAGVLILTAVILFVNGRRGKRDKRSDLRP